MHICLSIRATDSNIKVLNYFKEYRWLIWYNNGIGTLGYGVNLSINIKLSKSLVFGIHLFVYSANENKNITASTISS